ncbi:MAG: YceI family protein [Candidatus Paceibacteria bacterium]
MNKNISLVLFVVVVLVGGWYLMSMNKESLNTSTGMQSDGNTVSENQKVLNIVSSESKASYEIYEELRGKPTTVVGNSQAISGSVSLNKDSMMIEGGKISLDANSLKTDIAMRDENVKKMVLKSDQPGNETISFSITGVEGILNPISFDTNIPVKVVGDLTISGVTKSVTFDGTVNMMQDGSMKVLASTVLSYGDFGVAVPDLPFLANVAKTTKLTVDLVAR